VRSKAMALHFESVGDVVQLMKNLYVKCPKTWRVDILNEREVIKMKISVMDRGLFFIVRVPIEYPRESLKMWVELSDTQIQKPTSNVSADGRVTVAAKRDVYEYIVEVMQTDMGIVTIEKMDEKVGVMCGMIESGEVDVKDGCLEMLGVVRGGGEDMQREEVVEEAVIARHAIEKGCKGEEEKLINGIIDVDEFLQKYKTQQRMEFFTVLLENSV